MVGAGGPRHDEIGLLLSAGGPLFMALSLAMARPAGLALVLPVFTRSSLGAMPQAAFALALAMPAVPMTLRIVREAGSLGALQLLLFVGKESLVGILLGVLFGVPVWSVQSAGELFDVQRGATSGSQPDPGAGGQMSTSAALLSLAAITLFAIDGGLGVLAQTLYASYEQWPVLMLFPVIESGLEPFFLALLDHIERYMLVVAGPIVIALLVADIAAILIARSVPKLNIFDLAPTLRNVVFLLTIVFYTSFLVEYAGQELDGVRAVASQFKALFP